MDQMHVVEESTYFAMVTLEEGARPAPASRWPQQVEGPVYRYSVAKERLHSLMANVKPAHSSRGLRMVGLGVVLIPATPGKDSLRMVHANIVQQEQPLWTADV